MPMTTPIIGWEQTTPVPEDHAFNHFLSNHNGHLYLDDFDLMQLFEGSPVPNSPLASPAELVYLPLIRQRIQQMHGWFDDAIRQQKYDGRFLYTYASKANAAEEVIRTTLTSGAHHEMSSTIDVDIARLMRQRGLLTPDKMVLSNGFKAYGSNYANNVLQLQREHGRVIPIVEDLSEIPTLIGSQLPFDVGVRQKSYGNHPDIYQMDAADSRFGMRLEDVWKAAEYIEASPNLTLTMYHCMVGSQLTDTADFTDRLTPGLEIYARLKQRYPSLTMFNFGGGMPIPMTLDFTFDYAGFITQLLARAQEICGQYNVAVPDIVGEFGRYTTAEHGAHIFKVITTKDNDSPLPWYIIDGSIMTSFPDVWAIGEHFICLPLNHLDKPFQQVKLGGITCDSDDIYPQASSTAQLFLPVETDELYVGFFSVGAYQEMLGGVRGSKHCVLPEAQEIIIDKDANGYHTYEHVPGQSAAEVLNNLGYKT